jgi:hypothetical protein
MLGRMTALDVISQHFGPTNGVQLALIGNIARLPAARSRKLSE